MQYSEMDCDLADDALNKILGMKEDLMRLNNSIREYFYNAVGDVKDDVEVYCGASEQEFDELFYKEWRDLVRVSGAVDWSTQRIGRMEKRLDIANQITALQCALFRSDV